MLVGLVVEVVTTVYEVGLEKAASSTSALDKESELEACIAD